MSSHRKPSMNSGIKERFEDIREWIGEHTKIVMPAVLLVCVFITIIIALNANKRAAAEVESRDAQIEQAAVLEESTENVVQPLEENAFPAVNTLMNDYYSALSEGNIEKITSLNNFADETETIRIQEISKYIEAYPEITVYTKLGPVEGSYLAYVYSKVKFTEYDKLVPGMQAFYVCTDENGTCYINEGEDNSVVTDYIRDISLQDDVVDLNNKVAVEYNELLEGDDELNAFLADLGKRIDVSVGEALAKVEAPVSETPEESAEEAPAEGDTSTAAVEEAAPTIKTVRTTTVVNIRSSDSETADKIAKAQTGDEFTLIEEKGNGWSKISYEGKDAFVKTEFLEVASEKAAETTTQDTANTNDDTSTEETAPTGDGTTVTVKENVNVRASASTDGEKLGLVYVGEKLEVVMKQADGWTKVKYKGKTGYVKSEYVK